MHLVARRILFRPSVPIVFCVLVDGHGRHPVRCPAATPGQQLWPDTRRQDHSMVTTQNVRKLITVVDRELGERRGRRTAQCAKRRTGLWVSGMFILHSNRPSVTFEGFPKWNLMVIKRAVGAVTTRVRCRATECDWRLQDVRSNDYHSSSQTYVRYHDVCLFCIQASSNGRLLCGGGGHRSVSMFAYLDNRCWRNIDW